MTPKVSREANDYTVNKYLMQTQPPPATYTRLIESLH